MFRRATGRVVAVATALILGACSSPDAATPTTTTTPVIVSTTTTQTTIPPTIPPTMPKVAITVALPDHPGAQRAVTALYAWIGNRDLPPPAVPPELLDLIAGVHPDQDLTLEGRLTRAPVTGGRVGVVEVDDDLVLLADNGNGWEVVGAHLARFGLEPWYGPPVRHVLVIGTDARHTRQSPPLFRADAIHILSSNRERRAGEITGIPRDTHVQTSYGWDKFTHVNAVSPRHADEMLDIARDLSGLPIEGYVLTGFHGFRRIVDRLGGVMVEVPFTMVDDKAEADLAPGRQRLRGAAALAFSRIRSIPGGDFARSANQGVVILAALAALAERDITAIPELLSILSEDTWTDLTPGQLLTLAATAFIIDPGAVGNRVLAGTVTTVGGASVVVLDGERAERLFRDLDDGVVDG